MELPGPHERTPNGRTRVWLLADPAVLPPALSDRAVLLALVALLPEEAAALSGSDATAPDGPRVAALAAQGLNATEIAARLHISERTAYRRLARLRRSVGARNATELTARLNERGF